MADIIGFRKKIAERNPPDHGGFAVVVTFFWTVTALLTTAMLLAPLALRSSPAKAQPGAPGTDKQDGYVREVVTLDSEIADLDQKLGSLESRSDALAEEIARIDGEIEEGARRLARRRKALSDRARSIYVHGRASTLVMLLSSSDVSDFIDRTSYLEKVHLRDAELVRGIKRAAGELAQSREELKERKREVDAVASELRTRKSRLEESRAERQEVLSRAGSTAATVVSESERVGSKMDELNPPDEPSGRPTGRVLTMEATGYSPEEPGLDDNTASGLKARRGVVAVDPRVIPLGTRLHVEGYGNAIAADTGSAIKGNRIDLCFDTLEECDAYGRRTVRVEILD